MSTECGPWRSCDFHQYRSWLRKADCSTPTSSNPPDKDKQKVKKVRRRPAPGEYQLTFRHHGDPAEYERDYLTQVTHARCRASNPSATLLATELTSVRSSASDRSVVQLLPPRSCVSTESQPLTATAAAAAAAAGGTGQPRDTASTPDLSGDSASPPPRPTPPSSSPDLCQVSGRVAGGRPARRRRSLPPSAAASGAGAPPGTAAVPSRPAVRQPSFQPPAAAAVAAAVAAVRHARSMSVQRGDETDALPSPSAPLTPGQRRPPAARQPSTPHTVTLDLAGPAGLGGAAHLRRTAHKPRGLTKIQLASSVPENLTIIVGRKLEISLSGAKRGRQKGGKAFR